jgi:hypothetical protein
MNRRQLLRALGLGALVAPRFSFAQQTAAPKRVVFFVTPHGHVPASWKLDLPNAPTTTFAERALGPLQQSELPEVLRPLHPFRHKLLAIEGLAHTNVLEDIAYLHRAGGDANNHNVAVADLLTGARAAQHPGFRCTGGAISIDQVLGQRLAGPGRFASRVYGGDYVPNQVVAPFSFLGASQPTPLVKQPQVALADLLGRLPAPDERGAKLERARLSVLDSVAEEYRLVAAKLGAADRSKLEGHRQLVRDLEGSLAAQLQQQEQAQCRLSLDAAAHLTRQFLRLVRMAFACDLTRVVTYAAPVPACPEFGYPANADVHASYAHASVNGATSCGQTWTPLAERAMADLSVWYAEHFAFLLNELDTVPEGDGTLLDHTAVVWLTELGTPTHRHNAAFTVVAGGASGFFRTGRYLRYPELHDNPVTGSLVEWPRIGPAHNKLFVSLLNAMDQPDTQFGTTSATSSTGEVLDLTGPLAELR